MAAVCAKDIERLAIKLNSESPSKIKKALMALTKLTKNRENVRCFRLQGGLNRLLQLIRRTNKTMVDMALSALANCLLEEGSRLEVRRLDGIVALVGVFKRIQETSILNRTARALANLAENDLNTVVMEELGVIPELVKLLMTTSDTNCHQSVLRALRGICTTPERKSTVVDLDGFKTIVELLKTDKSNCCVRTVAEFTKNCSKEIAQQVQEYGGIKAIATLANSNNPQLRNPALLSLANLAYHSHVRVCIGSEGGIQALSSQVKRGEPVHVTAKAIEGICFCCREGINRARVHECGALELLLKIFVSGKPLHLEKKIVTAFTCFCFWDPSLEILVNGGLVPALVNHLGKIISHASLLEEVDDGLSDQLSFSSDFPLDSPRASTVKSSPFELKDANGEDIPEEKLFEKLEDTARKVSDTQASGRLTNFKKRMKLKPSPILTSPPPGVRTIGICQSVFSMAGRQADTTSLVSVCTPSCSISTLASSRSCSNIATSSFSSGLPSSSASSSSSSSPPSSSSSQHCALGTSNDLQYPNQSGPKHISAMVLREKNSNFPVIDHKTLPGNCDKGDPMISTPISTETSRSFHLSSPLSPKVGEEAHQHHCPGYSVLLLLSRISQMTDPSSLLVTKPCIQALLNYIAKVPRASPKCARLLNRLAANLYCFKALIVNGAVVAFHHQLCYGYQELGSHKESQQGGLVFGLSSEIATEDIGSNGAVEGHGNFRCNQMLLSTENCWQEVGKQLLDTLSSQAQTPFGKGVLENLLLKGCQEERQQCALALPILCRSEKLRLYFLVEKKALALFCELLTSTNEETFMVAVESLLVLAEGLQVVPSCSHSTREAAALNPLEDSKVHVPGKQTCSNLENHTAELPADSTVQSLTNARNILDEPPMAKRFKQDSTVLKPALSTNQKLCLSRTIDAACCMYKGSNLKACDVKFRMDSGEVISAHRQVIASASDVFTAMLSGDYLEGTLPFVPIRDISLDVFQTAVHFAYGCSLSSPCTAPRHKSSEPQETDTTANFYLELLTFADKFLMDGLKAACESCLIPLIDLVSVVQFCIAGVQLNTPKLSVHCLCYLLQVKIADLPKSFRLFKELFMSDEKEAIVKHLYQLLLSYLKG